MDSILNIKTDQAKKSNIQINTNILIPQNLNINFLTAVILLGNIFDNAIEACLKLPEERRKIDFKMNYIDSILYLELRNSFEKVQINQNNELITSKSDDPSLHGIGMQNVKAIVNKYNGIIKINTDNNRFSVKMVLYNIKTNYGN
ncbi:ATP-binding protein [Clostridium sp. JNZ J1-5]